MGTTLRAFVETASERIIDFCQRLLRASSLSGHEEEAAQLVLGEMKALGYDEARVDEVGNVIGKLAGLGGRSTLLHAHLDIVSPGAPAQWSHPPFAGERAEGYLWGRGASDTKGSLAAQVYALGLLREHGLKPAGDVYQVAAVGEELGGFGTHVLVQSLKPDLAIIGEPSGNTIRRGHRGRWEFLVTFHGRSAHASAPARGLNPHYSAARFMLLLRETPMRRDSTFGGSSVVPTLYYVDQTNSNVIPAQVTIHLDWRDVPGETTEEACALLQQVIDRSLERGITAQLEVRLASMRAYTGFEQTLRYLMPSFCLAADDPRVLAVQRTLSEALERPVPVDVWTFTTDGGQMAAAGIPCVGFGPGEEGMAHVLDERLEIAQLLDATTAYMALALEMGKYPQNGV